MYEFTVISNKLVKTPQYLVKIMLTSFVKFCWIYQKQDSKIKWSKNPSHVKMSQLSLIDTHNFLFRHIKFFENSAYRCEKKLARPLPKYIPSNVIVYKSSCELTQLVYRQVQSIYILHYHFCPTFQLKMSSDKIIFRTNSDNFQHAHLDTEYILQHHFCHKF